MEAKSDISEEILLSRKCEFFQDQNLKFRSKWLISVLIPKNPKSSNFRKFVTMFKASKAAEKTKFWKLLPTLFSKNCKTKFKSEISPWKMAIFDTVFDDFWQFLTLKILVTKFSKIRILAVQIWTSFPEIGLCHAPENWNFGKISGWIFQDLPIRVKQLSLIFLSNWYWLKKFKILNFGRNLGLIKEILGLIRNLLVF